jgi:hypothetical protein
VKRDIDPFTIDFFPEHYLLIEDRGVIIKTLCSQDLLVLDRVGETVLARLSSDSGLSGHSHGSTDVQNFVSSRRK